MKRKNRLLALVMALVMALSLLPGAALATEVDAGDGGNGGGGDDTTPPVSVYVSSTDGSDEDSATGTETSPYATLSHAYSKATAGATIYVMDALILDAAFSPTSDKPITISGKGYDGAKLTAGSEGNNIITAAGDYLSLGNITLSGNVSVPSGTSITATGNIYTEGDMTISGGDAATVDNGTGTPGSIKRGWGATGSKGLDLLTVKSGALTLSSITVDGNSSGTSYCGTLLDVEGGKAVLGSGAVLQNAQTATATNGAGRVNKDIIHVAAGAVLEITEGSEIKSNTTSGSNVTTNTINNEGAVVMSGGEISGNTHSRSVLNSASATFTMTGGSITGNTNSICAVTGGTINVSGAPQITENKTASSNGVAKNVLLAKGETIKITGALTAAQADDATSDTTNAKIGVTVAALPTADAPDPVPVATAADVNNLSNAATVFIPDQTTEATIKVQGDTAYLALKLPPVIEFVSKTVTGSGLSQKVGATMKFVSTEQEASYEYSLDNGTTWNTLTYSDSDKKEFYVASLKYGDHVLVRESATNDAKAGPAARVRVLDNALRNGSFEITIGTSADLKSGSTIYAWHTTDTQGRIEVYPFDAYKINRMDGLKCAELNAYENASLYQEVSTTPGAQFTWSLNHAARSTGTDVMAVVIGPVKKDGNYTKTSSTADDMFQTIVKSMPTKTPGETYDVTYEGEKYSVTIISDSHKWNKSTDDYTIPTGQTETVFAFTAISSGNNKPDMGNLLDAIAFEKSPVLLSSNVNGSTGRGQVNITNPTSDGTYKLYDGNGNHITKDKLTALGITAKDADGNEFTFNNDGAITGWTTSNTAPIILDVPAGSQYTVGATFTGDSVEKKATTVVPAVSESQLSSDVVKAATGNKITLTVNPADPTMSYGLVDAKGEAVGDWKAATDGKVEFTGLDPNKKYTIVAKPTGDETGITDKAATGSVIQTPQSLTDITANAVSRDSSSDNKDEIVVYPTIAGQEYGVIDKSNGEIEWKTSQNGEALAFEGLDPDGDYQVVTRTPASGTAGGTGLDAYRPASVPGKPIDVPSSTVKPSNVAISSDENGKGKITVSDTKEGVKYAVVDSNGDVIAPIGDDKDGWQTGNGGELTFAPLPVGEEYTVVTLPVKDGDTDPTDGGNDVDTLYPSNVNGQNLVGPTKLIPAVSANQLSGSVQTETEPKTATVNVKPADPDMEYGLVKKNANGTFSPVPNNLGSWRAPGEDGSVSFPGLEPETEYVVVAKPKGTTGTTVSKADGGATITTPTDKTVDADKIDRNTNNDGDNAGKDKIDLSGTDAKYDYAVVDKATGEVFVPSTGSADGWQQGTGTGNLTFDGLDPNREYEVIMRPHSDENTIGVPSETGTTVGKVGEVSLSGKIVDSDNKPVAGATVKVSVPTLNGAYTTLTAVTDKDGNYTLKGSGVKLDKVSTNNKFAVYVDSDSGVAVESKEFTKYQPQDLGSITVAVNDSKPTNVIGGVVSDGGKPVSSATITVTNKDTGATVTPDGQTSTTPGGGYAFGNLADGTYIVSTTKDGKSGLTEIKVENGKITPNSDGGFKSANIPVTKGGIVSGAVSGLAQGEKATVSMNVPLYEGDNIIGTKTVTAIAEGPNGHWQIAGVPDGSYPVTVTTPKGVVTGTATVSSGNVTTVTGVEPSNSMNATSNKLAITVPTATPDKPNAITGAVVDKDGKPVDNATVTIYNDKGESVGTATTGLGGGYTVPNNLPAGNYYISADNSDNSGKNGLTGPVKVNADGTVEGKTLVAVSDGESKLLEGTVTKSDSTSENPRPAAGATVVVKDSSGNVIATTKTNSNGQYFVGSVPANATVSIVTPDGESAEFTVSGTDATWDGDKTTAKAAAGSKPVIGPNGSKLPISTSTADGKATVTVTDSKGETVTDKFTVNDAGNLAAKTGDDAPAPGNYTVTITDANGMSAQSTITVNADGAIAGSAPIKITPHTVSGTVSYASGTIPSDASISVPGWGSAKVNTTTGKYELTGIPDGTYTATITVVDGNKTSAISVTLKVEDGVASYENPTADSTTGANVEAKGSNLTVTPTTAVDGIQEKIDAAMAAIGEAKKNPDDSNKLSAAIDAVKAAQSALNGASEEERKQISSSASKTLSDALAELMEAMLTITAKAEGVQNPANVQASLNSQKALLLEEDELKAAIAGKAVDVTLTLRAKDVTGEPTPSVQMDMPKVEAVASRTGAEEIAVFDIVVEKTTVVKDTATGVELSSATTAISKLPAGIELKLTIPAELRGFQYYGVVRVHEHGNAERVPSSVSGNVITLSSGLYSTYAVLASNEPIFEDDQRVSAGYEGGFAPVSKPDGSDYANCPKDETCPIHPFTDTSTTAWYHDGIHYCLDNGLMVGTGEGKFSPNSNTSRGMVVSILYRLSGSPAAAAANYSDVAAGSYYAGAVSWATAKGYAVGYGNGSFGPNDPITREQLAAILYRYAGSPSTAGMVLSEFTDAGNISAFATDAMRWAVGNGLIEGKGNQLLDPRGLATRAQTAAIIMRFCETIAK